MITVFLRRLLQVLPVLFGVCTLTFFLLHTVPGNPADIILGDQASPADRQSIEAQLGLNLPLHEQYFNYLTSALHLDFGESIYDQLPVFDKILEHLPATLELGAAAMLLALLISLPLGVFSAIKQYSPYDHTILISTIIGMSLPVFFLGPLFIWFFSLKLDLLPVSDRGGIENLILPAVTVALPMAAILIRMTRASMLEVIKEDYITVARAKGAKPFKIYFVHALRNAIMPVITIVGLQVGAVFTGMVVTETIFDWPGLGTLLYQSIQRRDYPTVQGCVLIISTIYVLVNFLTDIFYALANPKVRVTS